MKTIIEILGRGIIVFINLILLTIYEPNIKDIIPQLAPYSLHVIYTCGVILIIWMTIPLIDLLYGYNHKHDMYIRAG